MLNGNHITGFDHQSSLARPPWSARPPAEPISSRCLKPVPRDSDEKSYCRSTVVASGKPRSLIDGEWGNLYDQILDAVEATGDLVIIPDTSSSKHIES
jgi:hypothetical protein